MIGWFFFLLLESIVINKVRELILFINIKIIIIILFKVFKFGVLVKFELIVVSVDVILKVDWINVKLGWVIEIINVLKIIVDILIINILRDFFIVDGVNFFLKVFIFDFFDRKFLIVMIKIVSVVVFIFLLVDVGDVLINIKIIIINILFFCKVVKLSVLKLVVFVVIDWNIVDSIFFFKGKFVIVVFWLNFIRKINNVFIKISVVVENNIILECIFNFENFFFFIILSIIGNFSFLSIISV